MVARPVSCWKGCDSGYMQSLEDERNILVGPTAQYYSLNRGGNVDPLYNEPTNVDDDDVLYQTAPPANGGESVWRWFPPVDITCVVEFQEFENRDPSTQDEGKTVEWDATMRIAVNEWARKVTNGQIPKEGDVVFVFDQWFDVIKQGGMGNINDTTLIVGYSFSLKKRGKFTPDRKIT